MLTVDAAVAKENCGVRILVLNAWVNFVELRHKLNGHANESIVRQGGEDINVWPNT